MSTVNSRATKVQVRGPSVFREYWGKSDSTREVFDGDGWFCSGDVASVEDGQYRIWGRASQDIIITGGENVSSIEVEDMLYKHPDILEAAVVARPDDKWGETPCAFVTLKAAADGVTADQIIDYCRANIAHFKAPKTIVFCELPKTSTGKIQKFKLRKQTEEMGSLS